MIRKTKYIILFFTIIMLKYNLKYNIKYYTTYKMDEQTTPFDIITKQLKLMNKQIKALEKE